MSEEEQKTRDLIDDLSRNDSVTRLEARHKALKAAVAMIGNTPPSLIKAVNKAQADLVKAKCDPRLTIKWLPETRRVKTKKETKDEK